jgi:hypothetical protein
MDSRFFNHTIEDTTASATGNSHYHHDSELMTEILNQYYDSYICGVIQFLKKFQDLNIIENLLRKAMEMRFTQYCNFLADAYPGNGQVNCDIRISYRELYRLLNGELTRDHRLMQGLRNTFRNKPVDEINRLVKQCMSINMILRKADHAVAHDRPSPGSPSTPVKNYYPRNY